MSDLLKQAPAVYEDGEWRVVVDVVKGRGTYEHADDGPCGQLLFTFDHDRGITLDDYDGAFFLPRGVGRLLEGAGFIVPKECYL